MNDINYQKFSNLGIKIYLGGNMDWEYKLGISIVVLAITLNFCDFSKNKNSYTDCKWTNVPGRWSEPICN